MTLAAIRSLTAALVATGVAACGGPAQESATGTARVRLMNAASESPALDLLIGGALIAGGVSYQQASALTNTPAGNQALAIRQSGNSTVLLTRTIPIVANAAYALVVSGPLASLAVTQVNQPVSVDTGVAKPDRANIRIINIGGDVPTDSAAAPPPVPLDVYFTAPGADLAALTPLMSLDARYSSYSTLIYFDPGNWVVRFTTAGTKQVVAATPTIPIAAGQIRAVMLSKKPDGTRETSVVTELP